MRKLIYVFWILIICVLTNTACEKEKSTKDMIVGKLGYKYWVNHTATRDSASVLVINYFDINGKYLEPV